MKTRDGIEMENGMTVYAVNGRFVITGIVDTTNPDGGGIAILWYGTQRNWNTGLAYGIRENAEIAVPPAPQPKPKQPQPKPKQNHSRHHFTDDGDAGRDLDAEISYITSGREKRNFGC